MQQTSPDHLAREIERCAARADLFTPYAIGAGVLLLLMLLTCEAWATGLVLLLLLGGGFAVRRWNEERRTVRLVYDVDDPAAMDRFALASVIGEALASSAALWHVHREVSTSDARRNAGAKKLVSRTRTHCTRGAIPPIETNIEPWSISAGPQRLLFLPDRLLLFEGNRVAALPYEYLGASAEPSPMIEDGHVPPDAQQVSTTWRYVRNDGGPDLRFRDNRQLPVLRYGELTIGSGHGVRIVLQMSHAEAAPRAAQALETLAATARAYAAPTAFTPAAVSPPSPAAHVSMITKFEGPRITKFEEPRITKIAGRGASSRS